MRRTMAWPMRPVPMKPTFMAMSSPRIQQQVQNKRLDSGFARSRSRPGMTLCGLLKLRANPFELARDVIDDVAGLEMIREHVPGIGLDLELPRQRLPLVEFQRVLDGEARGAEFAEIVEEHR